MFAAEGVVQPTSVIWLCLDVYFFIMLILFHFVVQKWLFILIFHYIILFLK